MGVYSQDRRLNELSEMKLTGIEDGFEVHKDDLYLVDVDGKRINGYFTMYRQFY